MTEARAGSASSARASGSRGSRTTRVGASVTAVDVADEPGKTVDQPNRSPSSSVRMVRGSDPGTAGRIAIRPRTITPRAADGWPALHEDDARWMVFDDSHLGEPETDLRGDASGEPGAVERVADEIVHVPILVWAAGSIEGHRSRFDVTVGRRHAGATSAPSRRWRSRADRRDREGERDEGPCRI